MSATDQMLLQRYLTEGDEGAFGVLVERYLPLVLGVARRVTGNEELAREASQRTLIRLARRAALVPEDASLGAWLHRMARHEAIDLVRSEARRRKRELVSFSESSAAMESSPEPSWAALAPVIDDLVNRLSEGDRDMLLRRYYRNESHAEIASQLGLASEGVARQRAFRALEKLRALLAKRGITTSSAMLATLLPVHGSPAAAVPAGLSSTILNAASGITPLAPHGLQAFFLTVNTFEKSALAGIALLLLTAASKPLVAGGGAMDSSVLSSTMTEADRAPLRKISGARRGGRPVSVGSPEEQLTRLREILGMADERKRASALMDLLDQLSAEQMKEAAEIALSDPRAKADLFNSESLECKMIMAAWARLDAPEAAGFAKARCLPCLWIILEQWVPRDPEGAITWTKSHWDDRYAKIEMGDILAEVYRSNPQEALRHVGEISDPRERREILMSLCVKLSYRRGGLDGEITLPAEGELRTEVLGEMATALSNRNPERGLQLLLENPEAAARTDVASFYGTWAGYDSKAAVESLAQLPVEGGMLPKAVRTIGKELMANQPADAFALLDAYPGAATDETVGALLDAAVEAGTDPAFSLGQTGRLADEQRREDSYARQLRLWLGKDPASAEAWMKANAGDLPEGLLPRLERP